MTVQPLSVTEHWQSDEDIVSVEYAATTATGGGAFGDTFADFTETDIEIFEVEILGKVIPHKVLASRDMSGFVGHLKDLIKEDRAS